MFPSTSVFRVYSSIDFAVKGSLLYNFHIEPLLQTLYWNWLQKLYERPVAPQVIESSAIGVTVSSAELRQSA